MIKPNTTYPISKSQYFEKQRQDQDIISVRWRSSLRIHSQNNNIQWLLHASERSVAAMKPSDCQQNLDGLLIISSCLNAV
jgi:hypothetical protein